MQTLNSPFPDASLDVYLAEGAETAVVICPGGGYAFLSKWEDSFVARAFNEAGYHAVVLHYEVERPPLRWRPLRQLAWTVAAVRGGEIPGLPAIQKVAVCGFSAGGHLAASLGVQWHNPALFSLGTDLLSHRPDALILGYPVISGGDYAHPGSFTQLAGEDRSAWAEFSLEQMVDEKSVPAFLWHAVPDESVSVQNSLLFFQALLHSRVPAELHLYPFGTHGMSLATSEVARPAENRLADAHVATWLPLAERWLADIFFGRTEG
ncbi:alpha/beta hydrolase [Oscillibacter sp.]|uniref:alpha/beta hydrolase n=1 Tax=Oscillibacter sp. TaxID=1945593 RepID=UPI00289AD30C|nr:alpha/beta hydrolase [Oscillibacter sp.]